MFWKGIVYIYWDLPERGSQTLWGTISVFKSLTSDATEPCAEGGIGRSMAPSLLCSVVRLGFALSRPQELLDRGVCEEVERVRLSERYQSMKVRTGRTPVGLTVPHCSPGGNPPGQAVSGSQICMRQPSRPQGETCFEHRNVLDHSALPVLVGLLKE